jgi:hypothetical protein
MDDMRHFKQKAAKDLPQSSRPVSKNATDIILKRNFHLSEIFGDNAEIEKSIN